MWPPSSQHNLKNNSFAHPRIKTPANSQSMPPAECYTTKTRLIENPRLTPIQTQPSRYSLNSMSSPRHRQLDTQLDTIHLPTQPITRPHQTPAPIHRRPKATLPRPPPPVKDLESQTTCHTRTPSVCNPSLAWPPLEAPLPQSVPKVEQRKACPNRGGTQGHDIITTSKQATGRATYRPGLETRTYVSHLAPMTHLH